MLIKYYPIRSGVQLQRDLSGTMKLSLAVNLIDHTRLT